MTEDKNYIYIYIAEDDGGKESAALRSKSDIYCYQGPPFFPMK